MANLVQIKHSDLSPTLDALGKLGVVVEDFNDLRRYPDFAKQVAQIFTERRAKINMALDTDEGLALLAIKELADPKLLVEIIHNALLVSVAKAALFKIPPYEAYHIARIHPHMDVVEEALGRTDDRNLWMLLSSVGCTGRRHELAQAEYKKRHGENSPFRDELIPSP